MDFLRHKVYLLFIFAFFAVSYTHAQCPSFPNPLYNSLVYNLGCVPWDLEFQNGGNMYGDVTGATFQWYRYPQGGSRATATPCAWQTDHSTCNGFKPATDEMGSYYIYFCKVTTPSCPNGAESGDFIVQVGPYGDPCATFGGATFTITSGGSNYTSGQDVTITAHGPGTGGDHVYRWYHNGEEIDFTDPHYEYVWNFTDPQLIIHNVTPADGGTYSVSMQDGTTCFLYTDPVRVLVDNPTCGPNPTLSVAKDAICAGDNTSTNLTNNQLASGEIGKLEYMLKPDGSNPTTTAPGTWTADKAGLYQFKYVVENPNNESCFRESKVVSVTVYAGGADATITPTTDVLAIQNQLLFTVSAPGENETGSITFTSDGGQSGSIWPNTYPNYGHTCYSPGLYTYTYTITNSKAGCTRTAQCQVLWYQCDWGTARFNASQPANNSTVKMGTSIDLKPVKPTVNGIIGEYTYSLDGGAPVTIDPDQPFTPTAPGTYIFKWEYKHKDSRVTDCRSEITRTIIVESCGTQATIASDKSEMKAGESATITYNSPASGETAVLSYTKDGGTSQPLATTPSPYTFAPTDAGTYVITYTITTPNCGDNSKFVTIQVYDCGPAASITADHEKVQPGGAVTFTLSSPGADETGTVTYSKDGGAAQTFNANVFNPTAEGVYVFTYSITHSHVDCTRSAQVTVTVASCGAPVSISADKNVLRPNESATLTLSRQPDTQAGETSTLTYSKDGGAAQDMTNTTFTPTETGTYVITYTIKNSVLDCEANAKETITVYDCGPDATISVDKNIIKLGGTVAISLSAPGTNETAALTYSKDGGAPQTITGNTFTPSAAGTYTLTYTISHAYIDCQRSASATFTVYDCGIPATISADKSEMIKNETVTLTLSVISADETAALTYSKDGGPAQTITGTTFTPTEPGTYVITYTVKHNKIDCTTSAQVTITVYGSELVFDDKNGSRLWSDPKNWWPSYNRIPTITDSAVIRKPCEVDIPYAQVYDLTVDMTPEMVYMSADAAVTILPDAALLVAHLLVYGYDEAIYIESNNQSNGALILGADNVNIPATALFHARSAGKDALPVWQYIGYPMQDNPLIKSVYPDAIFYEWTNTPNSKVGGNWLRVDSLSGNLSPFVGYAMTQTAEQIYTIRGKLNDPIQKAINIPYNDQGDYPGFAFVANSWIAPIDIAAMETSDFGAADATVYIMNAGTYAEALQQQGKEAADGTGAARGQYNTIPVHAASYLPNALKVIPPMQGFFVHATKATTLNLDYSKTIYQPALKGVNTTPTRAPQKSDISILRMYVEGFGAEDEVWILTGNEFSTRFDNGWDGYKARSDNSPVSMAVLSADGPLAIAALPEMEGMEIAFEGGNHKTYTLDFEIFNRSSIADDLYLHDLMADTYTLIVDGARYSFQCGAEAQRFMITRQNGTVEQTDIPRPEKFLYNGILYIRNGERLYNASGESVHYRSIIGPLSVLNR